MAARGRRVLEAEVDRLNALLAGRAGADGNFTSQAAHAKPAHARADSLDSLIFRHQELLRTSAGLQHAVQATLRGEALCSSQLAAIGAGGGIPERVVDTAPRAGDGQSMGHVHSTRDLLRFSAVGALGSAADVKSHNAVLLGSLAAAEAELKQLRQDNERLAAAAEVYKRQARPGDGQQQQPAATPTPQPGAPAPAAAQQLAPAAPPQSSRAGGPISSSAVAPPPVSLSDGRRRTADAAADAAALASLPGELRALHTQAAMLAAQHRSAEANGASAVGAQQRAAASGGRVTQPQQPVPAVALAGELDLRPSLQSASHPAFAPAISTQHALSCAVTVLSTVDRQALRSDRGCHALADVNSALRRLHYELDVAAAAVSDAPPPPPYRAAPPRPTRQQEQEAEQAQRLEEAERNQQALAISQQQAELHQRQRDEEQHRQQRWTEQQDKEDRMREEEERQLLEEAQERRELEVWEQQLLAKPQQSRPYLQQPLPPLQQPLLPSEQLQRPAQQAQAWPQTPSEDCEAAQAPPEPYPLPEPVAAEPSQEPSGLTSDHHPPPTEDNEPPAAEGVQLLRAAGPAAAAAAAEAVPEPLPPRQELLRASMPQRDFSDADELSEHDDADDDEDDKEEQARKAEPEPAGTAGGGAAGEDDHYSLDMEGSSSDEGGGAGGEQQRDEEGVKGEEAASAAAAAGRGVDADELEDFSGDAPEAIADFRRTGRR